MKDKKFKEIKGGVKQLISPIGSCYASDMITVEGLEVGYMYREEPMFKEDSGWRFFSGKETQEYVDNPDNLMLFDVNTIANFDPHIIPYLKLTIGSELVRNGDQFEIVKEDTN